MQALIVDDDENVRQFSSLCIENVWPDCKIIQAINAEKAIELLKLSKEEISYIICDYQMPGGNGNILYKYLRDSEYSDIPFVMYSGSTQAEINDCNLILEDNNAILLEKPMMIDQFEQELKKFLPHSVAPVVIRSNNVDAEYRKVRISYFWRYNKSLCDIFLRLGPSKYVKIIHGNDYYNKSIIDKYVKLQQKYLHIKKEDFSSFSESITSQPFLYYDNENREDIKLDEREEQMKTTHAILQDLVNSVGVSKNAISMANVYMEDINTITKGLTLGKLFDRIKTKNNYLYDHSYILSCITTEVSRKLEWHTSKTIEKLCYASLFHDITLDDPDLAMLSTIKEAELKGYTEEEIERFRIHPEAAARIILECDEIPPDTAKIIVQHHELPSGDGFPKKLMAGQTNPMTCCFIIAHHLIDELYKIEFDENQIPEILKLLRPQYQSGNYARVFKAFLESFAPELITTEI